jgi:ribosomal protein L6P/L9E
MKSEKEVSDAIDMLRGIDDESVGFVAAAIAALEWVLK